MSIVQYADPYHMYTIYRQGYQCGLCSFWKVSPVEAEIRRGVFPPMKCPLFHSDLNQTYSTYSPDRPSVTSDFLWNIFTQLQEKVVLLSQTRYPLLSTELNGTYPICSPTCKVRCVTFLVNMLSRHSDTEGNVHCSPFIVDWPQPLLHDLQPRHTKCDAWHSYKISSTQAKIQKENYFVCQVKCPLLLTDLYQTYVTSQPEHRKCDVWLFWKNLLNWSNNKEEAFRSS
jgi:hypothetical protein